MGKASSAKKVARAARAGGTRRSGQRRALGFPLAIGAVLVLGLVMVFVARDRRNADAFPRANQDHVHAAIDIYTCIPDTGGATTTTTSTTTSTTATTAPADPNASTTSSTTTSTSVPATSTTIAAPGDVPGEFQPPPTDATQDVLGIHTHGDGLIHIHPFSDSVAGRKATLGVFLDQVGISVTDTSLTLKGGAPFTEGTTKCQGGKDGIVQVAKWDHATDAAKGAKPNQIFKSGFDKIRLGANEAFTIAFMPDGSTIPAKSDVADRISKVSDLAPSTTAPASSGAPPASGSSSSGTPSSSAPPASGSSSSASGSSTTEATATTLPGTTTSTAPASSSSGN